MDICWYSPTDIKLTEIARYSSLILPFLAQKTAVANASDCNFSYSDGRHCGSVKTREAMGSPGSPLPVYHIGNNPLHLEIYQLSQARPGVIVIHDLGLVDLAIAVSHSLGDPEAWMQMMERQYGAEGGEIARLSENSMDDYVRMVSDFPLFQPFVENALGVVVHSNYARDALVEYLPPGTPVIKLDLPYPEQAPAPVRQPDDTPLRFVFCGHVGPNRRLLEFFEAWGGLAEPGKIRLEIYGQVLSSSELKREAERFGVADYLSISGYVSDKALDKALRSARFALNLRKPTVGEASASQLRYWAAGLTTLVTDIGWYAELPDEVVCKVDPKDEIASIRSLLQGCIDEPDRYAQVGMAGARYLREQHSPQAYVEGLLSFVEARAPARLAHEVCDSLFVNTVAALCPDEKTLNLFHHPVAVAAQMFETVTDQKQKVDGQ